MASIISLIVSIILTAIGATISFTANTMTIMSTTLISTGVAALGISGIFFIVVDRPDDFDDDDIGMIIYYCISQSFHFCILCKYHDSNRRYQYGNTNSYKDI